MSFNTSAYSGSVVIKPNVAPQSIDGVMTKTPLINAFAQLGKLVPTAGSATLAWNYQFGRDVAASAWTENESITSFGSRLYVQASQAAQYKKVPFGLTDFQMANLRNGGLYEDSLSVEREKAASDLLKAYETAFVGNGASVGISALINSTGTAHGINASTVSAWSSIQNTCSGSSFVSVLDDTLSDLSATNSSLTDLVLFMSPEVSTIYQGAVASNMRGLYGQPLDLGKSPVGAQLSYNGIPIVVIPGASATECYFVDTSKAHIFVHIAPEVVAVPATNMGENLVARAAMALILEDRAVHGKITAIDLRSS